MKALAARGMSRDDLPYKAPFQPWGSWFAFGSTIIITIFKGFDTFIPFNSANFVTYVLECLQHLSKELIQSFRSYIGIPIFLILWLGYKLVYRTRVIPPKDVDLVSGIRTIDEEEAKFVAEEKAKGPRSFAGRIWDSM